MEHCKRKWHKFFMYKENDKFFMYSWKRNRKYFVSKLRKLERKFFHTYKMHFYLYITTWYILTFELSVQFVRHAFHLWFLLIFYDDVYRLHIPPPCLVSWQIILKTLSPIVWSDPKLRLKKGQARRSRTLQGMWVQASKLIWLILLDFSTCSNSQSSRW